MGRTSMEKKRNFNSNGSMWDSPSKEALGRPRLRWEDPVKKDVQMIDPSAEWKVLTMGIGK